MCLYIDKEQYGRRSDSLELLETVQSQEESFR